METKVEKWCQLIKRANPKTDNKKKKDAHQQDQTKRNMQQQIW